MDEMVNMFAPFLNESFAIVISVYLLYERSKTNEKILSALQEVTLCIKQMKEDIKELKR
ncbi:MAG: hypothetical protein LHW59_10345 [Candidatus Cloacimonetes bacterium]|nr:hypothetical protein [Candidatus Cloacimonadota bacterium]